MRKVRKLEDSVAVEKFEKFEQTLKACIEHRTESIGIDNITRYAFSQDLREYGENLCWSTYIKYRTERMCIELRTGDLFIVHLTY